MEAPQRLLVTAEELKARFQRTCELKQEVNWGKIVECFQQWSAEVGIGVSPIVRLESVEQFKQAARVAWNTYDTRAANAQGVLNDAYAGSIESPRSPLNAATEARTAWAGRLGVDADAVSFAWGPAIGQNAVRTAESGRVDDYYKWYPMLEAFEAGAFCFFITDRSIEVSTLPAIVKVDDRNRLHSEFGPAFVWLDDVWEFYWHGVRVESYVVENPERITVAEIEAEPNVEIRRVKIERFGQVRYLIGSGAQEIHRDDYGTLYRKEVPGDEPLVMVKVVNATPEPDGSFKDYFLRVPPTLQTAGEAVAWTFGKSPEDYEPLKET